MSETLKPVKTEEYKGSRVRIHRSSQRFEMMMGVPHGGLDRPEYYSEIPEVDTDRGEVIAEIILTDDYKVERRSPKFYPSS